MAEDGEDRIGLEMTILKSLASKYAKDGVTPLNYVCIEHYAREGFLSPPPPSTPPLPDWMLVNNGATPSTFAGTQLSKHLSGERHCEIKATS